MTIMMTMHASDPRGPDGEWFAVELVRALPNCHVGARGGNRVLCGEEKMSDSFPPVWLWSSGHDRHLTVGAVTHDMYM